MSDEELQRDTIAMILVVLFVGLGFVVMGSAWYQRGHFIKDCSTHHPTELCEQMWVDGNG